MKGLQGICVTFVLLSICLCAESDQTEQGALEAIAKFVNDGGSSKCTAPVIENCAASSRCDFTCTKNYIALSLDAKKHVVSLFVGSLDA